MIAFVKRAYISYTFMNSSDRYKVIYLTGAPATGKSTLCWHVKNRLRNIVTYSYSELLRDYVNRNSSSLVDECDIRQQSASIVTSYAVKEVDKWLHNELQTKRVSQHSIIDSHPVTKEEYGFRVTPFNPEQLNGIDPDIIICLYAKPDVIAERIRKDPAGRPLPSVFDIDMHLKLQASLAAQYSFSTGKPLYLLDSGMKINALADQVINLTGI